MAPTINKISEVIIMEVNFAVNHENTVTNGSNQENAKINHGKNGGSLTSHLRQSPLSDRIRKTEVGVGLHVVTRAELCERVRVESTK